DRPPPGHSRGRATARRELAGEDLQRLYGRGRGGRRVPDPNGRRRQVAAREVRTVLELSTDCRLEHGASFPLCPVRGRQFGYGGVVIAARLDRSAAFVARPGSHWRTADVNRDSPGYPGAWRGRDLARRLAVRDHRRPASGDTAHERLCGHRDL